MAVRVNKNLIELKVFFLEIVHPDLYSGKVWGFSISSFCIPPGEILGRLLLKTICRHVIAKNVLLYIIIIIYSKSRLKTIAANLLSELVIYLI